MEKEGESTDLIPKERTDIEKIKDGETILIIAPAKKIIETNVGLLKKYVSEKKYNVVYVTINKPFSTLIERFKQEKIDTSKIFIIDAITPRPLADKGRTENAVFIGSPKALTDISISTTSLIEKLKTAKILLLDSISTLLLYNDFEMVRNFIHFITNKMRELNITVIMTYLREMDHKKSFEELSVFADEIIRL